ncbi:29816_t:CDS:1 [Gigaspora margarita]|uniref:29816_t:CDS:1 n=2 Tax=Gigaspora margarita TaxID=4874 RepID=A0ABM8VYM9_GIGMA|nr:putative riboflavin aldehydeforming enzyme [Gigaspora margarita]CAG8479893.1 29816_t:CDS:1 [Gigaspora margarita]
MSKHQRSTPENVLTSNTSHSNITLNPLPTTSRLSSNSAETFETISGDENDQTTLIKGSNGVPIEPPKATKISIPSSITDQEESSNLKKSTSLLGRSLSFLNRKEERQSQLVKIHKYTIYDSEKEEFIEIIEEEWEGDGPPPRQSVASQHKSTILVDKELPSLPEPIPTKEESNFRKFHRWVENKWVRHKRINLIILSLIVLLLFILIILAAAGVFAKPNQPENNNNGNLNNGHNLKPAISTHGD